jgi:microcystin degradation protein MlrC
MRIVVGSLQHETNTLTPLLTKREDFEILHGQESLGRLAAVPLFEEAGATIIPTLYANTVPSGEVEKDTFCSFRDEMLDGIARAMPVDGIWLYLHGAMDVEDIGSGEAHLLAEIRKVTGYRVPIALALDLHANIARELIDHVNVICGYRTAPHTDQKEAQTRAAEALLQCIKEGILPRPVILFPPLVTPGDAMVTTIEPGTSLLKELEVTDAVEDIICASIFGGNPWVDRPNMGASVVVAAKRNRDVALKEARRLAQRFWDVRTAFRFEAETADPEEAIEMAMNSTEFPVFLSDSGDNTTGGAPGDNAHFLALLMEKGARGVLFAGIADAPAFETCNAADVGDEITVTVGGTLDPARSESVEVTGTVKVKSARIISWIGGDGGPGVVLAANGIDVLITKKRCSVISPEIMASAGVRPEDYRVIVVKLGYLFDELRKISRRAIIAFTEGATCEKLEKIEYHEIRRPLYPLDKDFEWHAESA